MTLTHPRSVLAVPVSSPRFIKRGLASLSDVLMLDLEDGVAPADRPRARDTLRELFATEIGDRPAVWVRVNAADTDDFAADAALVRDINALGRLVIVLPMTTLRSVEIASAALPGTPITAMVETPAGIEDAVQLAGHQSVVGLMFGELDFIATMASTGALRFSDTSWAHSRLINAAAAAGTWTIAGPFPDIADPDGLRAVAVQDAAIGFAGKLCIHPDQLATVNEAFSPSEADREWATALLAEFDSFDGAPGAFRFRGRMVDAPVVARARTIVEIKRYAP